MFLPMSWTSPLTVAIKIRPRVLCSWTAAPFPEPLPAAAAALAFSASMNGVR